MASTAIFEAVKSRIAAMFPDIPLLAFDDIDQALEQGSDPFFTLDDAAVTGGEELACIGDPTNLMFEEISSVLIYAFVPAPESSETLRATLDSIADAMRVAQLQPAMMVTTVSPPIFDTANVGLWSTGYISIVVRREHRAGVQT